MAKILAFTNQKGGVGKTTSAVNIALSLAVTEVKTLLIDLDPQANATTGLADLFEESNSNIYDVLIKKKPIKPARAPRGGTRRRAGTQARKLQRSTCGNPTTDRTPLLPGPD